MDSTPPSGITLIEQPPGVDDFRRLRAVTGLYPRTLEAARAGLARTLYGVSLVHDGRTIGMGRIVGDGGCFFTVVDIAVDPAYQRRGLGKRIMDALDAWLRANAPESSCVGLVAEGESKHLYAKYGFLALGDELVAMEYMVGPR